MSNSSLALSNLRAFVILLVVAFHSFLAYLGSQPTTPPPPFDSPPYHWKAIPIVDSERWFGFDLFCAFQYVYLMSFMFFLSGLFVWSSLARKGARAFLHDRLLRLGVPFVLGVYLLMPVAHYPVYRVTAVDPSWSAFWSQWTRAAILAKRTAVVLVVPAGAQYRGCWALPVCTRALANILAGSRRRPALIPADISLLCWRSPAGLCAVGDGLQAVAMAAIRSDRVPTELDADLHRLFFCRCRYRRLSGSSVACSIVRHAGAALGGLAGQRARRFCAVDYPHGVEHGGGRRGCAQPLRSSRTLALVVSSATACFGLIAVFLRLRRFAVGSSTVLSENAYGIYLVHYVFVIWLQYLLLGRRAVCCREGRNRFHRYADAELGGHCHDVPYSHRCPPDPGGTARIGSRALDQRMICNQ